MQEPELRDACLAEAARYEAAIAELERLGGDLLEPFRGAAEPERASS